MGHDCRLHQVVLHCVLGHHYAFVGYLPGECVLACRHPLIGCLLWILREGAVAEESSSTVGNCPVTGCRGKRSCSCSLNARETADVYTNVGTSRCGWSRNKENGRGKQSIENQIWNRERSRRVLKTSPLAHQCGQRRNHHRTAVENSRACLFSFHFTLSSPRFLLFLDQRCEFR